MPDPKLIAVIGATGAQGGGLARAILADPSGGFAVRALTRKTTSDAALALSRAGAQVEDADLDDVASLVRAFDGAHGVFAVTNFWEHFSAEKEVRQAANIAEAAKRAGVHHVVWSTLEDTRTYVPLDDPRMPTLHGRYKVPHFDGKGEADAEFASRGVPTTYLLTSFYWENFIAFGMGPQKQEDGTYAFGMPLGDRAMACIAAEDIGKCAYGVFKAGDEFIGKRIGIVGENLTGAQMAEGLSRALGVTVRYHAMPPEVYRGLGFPGADDLGNMFQFYHDFNDVFLGHRDRALSKRLNPALQSWDAWLAAHASRIPLSA
jgi:uncharacterized protein YbjT (DUF2867 family)